VTTGDPSRRPSATVVAGVAGGPPSRLRRHALFLLYPLCLAAIYLICLRHFDRLAILGDSMYIFHAAERLIVEKTVPVTGNGFYGKLHLGPLAEFLTALPLLFSRHFIMSYYFLWFLYLASAPVFYLAMWRHFARRSAAFAATLWFVYCGMTGDNMMQTPWNTSYLPLFLALYALVLLSRPERFRLLVLYLTIGACAHLHVMTASLIPAAVVFLWDTGKPAARQALWHLAGVAVVLLLQAPVFLEAHVNDGAMQLEAVGLWSGALSHFSPAMFWDALKTNLAFALPFFVALPAYLVERSEAAPAKVGGIFRVAVVVAMQILCIALVIGVARAGPVPHYFLPEMPFLCFGVGAAFEIAEKQRRPLNKVAGMAFPLAATVLIQLSILRSIAGTPQVTWNSPNWQYSVNATVAESLHGWLQEKGIRKFASLTDYWLAFADGKAVCRPERYDEALIAVLSLEHPEYDPMDPAASDVYAVIFSRWDDPRKQLYPSEPMSQAVPAGECDGPRLMKGGLLGYFCLHRDGGRWQTPCPKRVRRFDEKE